MHAENLGAGLLARPATPGEVARVLALCARYHVGVVPQGGRTGLAGGAVSQPGELILSLERMNRIEAVMRRCAHGDRSGRGHAGAPR